MEQDFEYASDTDWDRADALQRGYERPEQAWVCTDRDVWHRNPYYKGPPVPHPEEYESEPAEEPAQPAQDTAQDFPSPFVDLDDEAREMMDNSRL